jgi:hypothetical protein
MPIPDSIRHHFERLSTQMTNLERVMRPLGLCPAETDAQDWKAKDRSDRWALSVVRPSSAALEIAQGPAARESEKSSGSELI